MGPVRPPVPLFAALLCVLGSSPACGPSKPPTTSPTAATPDGTVLLRYAAPSGALQQDLSLELTHASVGSYVEATLELRAAITMAAQGDGLQVDWELQDIATLDLGGTVQPEDTPLTQALLLTHGKGTTIGDAHGLLDPGATDAAASNKARAQALIGPPNQAPPAAGVLLMTLLEQQLQLPRLPAQPLRPDEPVELEEESETVLADSDLVLPTTTVLRFTLRGVEAGVAEVAVERASVAQPDVAPLDVDAEPQDPQSEQAREPAVRLVSRIAGTLLFDVQQGIPVSLSLSGTETIQIGDQEGERSLSVRSAYRIP